MIMAKAIFLSTMYFIGLGVISESIGVLSTNGADGFLALGIGIILYVFVLVCEEKGRERRN